MEGTYEEEISYLSGIVSAQGVRFIPVSLTATRAPGLSVKVLNDNQHNKSNHLARKHPRKEAGPIRCPKIKHSSPARCAHVIRPTRVQLPALQPTNARFTPVKGTAFLKTRETVTKDTPLESIWCLLQVR